MARRREENERRGLERGEISLMYRPRLRTDDVQRLLLVLRPDDQPRFRVVVIGRRRLDRFWGFVDLVLYSPHDLRAVLDSQIVKGPGGVQHIPAAVPIAAGTYELAWRDGQAHLHYEMEDQRGDYVMTVANPDPKVWGLADSPSLQSDLFDETEVHVTVPSPFPPRLQQRFNNQRMAPLDSIEFLDHPGAELIFQRITTDRLSAAT